MQQVRLMPLRNAWLGCAMPLLWLLLQQQDGFKTIRVETAAARAAERHADMHEHN
jgi:hypothetical protein